MGVASREARSRAEDSIPGRAGCALVGAMADKDRWKWWRDG
jgi:hypothetical protein